MNVSRFYHSLRSRILASVLIPLLFILSALLYARYVRHQETLMANLRRSAADAGETVERSLLHAMRINDFSLVQQIMEDIAGHEGVLNLILLDKPGRVVLASQPEMVGKTMEISDVTCQACHRYEAASRNESVTLTLDGAEKVFRNVNAIENTEECTGCHGSEVTTLGVLITDFDMAPIEEVLESDRASSVLWSVLAIALVLTVANLSMRRAVVDRLLLFVEEIRRVGQGDLDYRADIGGSDEIAQLAKSFNHMAEGLKEKQELEESLKQRSAELQVQTEQLSVLNTLATTVSRSLNLEEILTSALEIVLDLVKLDAGWVLLGDKSGEALSLVAHRGLPEELAKFGAAALFDGCICSTALEEGRPQVSPDEAQTSCAGSADACHFAEQLCDQGLVVHACVPLKSKDRVLGVMTLAGSSSRDFPSSPGNTDELLTAVGRQIGIAVENASLYEELKQNEAVRRQLLERLIIVQEDERKRIARELHDQTGQRLTSLIMTLKVLGEANSLSEVRSRLQDLRDAAAEIMADAHDLALELRPSVLDDLGLVAALRQYLRGYRDRFRLTADFQAVGATGERLPPDVEMALYRIAQEALSNVARHADARGVSVLLENRADSVVLIVEDNGRGFDVSRVMGSRAHAQNLGLFGMRERAALIGGTLTIESTPGVGTTVFVEIPLHRESE